MSQIFLAKKVFLGVLWGISLLILSVWFRAILDLRPVTMKPNYPLEFTPTVESRAPYYHKTVLKFLNRVKSESVYHVVFNEDRGVVPPNFFLAGLYSESTLDYIVSNYSDIVTFQYLTLFDSPFMFKTFLFLGCAVFFNFAFFWLWVSIE